MKIVLAIVGMLLALLIGFVWYMEMTERRESHFETYEELQSSELIAKGWVPDFIPQSAYDIYEKHRVDAGRVHVWFRFAPGDTAKIDRSCSKQPAKNAEKVTYQCKHRNSLVIVTLNADGTGEIASD